MIDTEPTDWRDLQNKVAAILHESGLQVKREHTVHTARGHVEIDVYAEDVSSRLTLIYFCECKHWQNAVPQTIVHGFRTIMSDFGAHIGFIISSNDFQKGAFEAAQHSNVQLLTWHKFQELFVDRWLQRYLSPKVNAEVSPLIEYTETFNSRIIRKAKIFNEEQSKQFAVLREKYAMIATSTALLCHTLPFYKGDGLLTYAPPAIRDSFKQSPMTLDHAGSLRILFENWSEFLRCALSEFDQLFGERA